MSTSADPTAWMSTAFAQWSEQQRGLFDAALTQAQAMAAAVKPTPAGAAAFPFDPGAALPNLAQSLMGRVTEAPTLATLWDLDRKMAHVQAAWLQWQLASAQSKAVVDSCLPQAQQAYQSQLAAARAQGQTPGWRESVDLWLAALNTALLALMREDRYAQSQRKAFDAGLTLRETLAEVAEDWCETFQLPGRREVDDLARSVVELRRELRALQRATRPATVAPPPKKAARAKPSRLPRT
ncbi:MAG: poly(R)-hydroxyalkanoic acid synthase subunit PhaE [Burkholderiales bacterium]